MGPTVAFPQPNEKCTLSPRIPHTLTVQARPEIRECLEPLGGRGSELDPDWTLGVREVAEAEATPKLRCWNGTLTSGGRVGGKWHVERVRL